MIPKITHVVYEGGGGRCPEVYVPEELTDSTHVIVDRGFFDELLAVFMKENDASLGGRFNTQCPDCGYVAEGFDTEEEAEAWVCDQCQLPLFD